MIDIALFGLGRIGVMHGKNLMRNREFNLKYIYDIDKNLSKKYSKILKSIAVNSPSEIFKDKDIKAIFIASTTSTHIKLILEGVKNKKIIFCEKPLDLSIKKINECKKIIKKFNPKIQLGFNRRYDPGHFRLKQELTKGKIGKLEKIIITSRDPAPPSIKYLKESGGIFRDMMIHDFDLVRFYLEKDEPLKLIASGSNISDKRFIKIKDYELKGMIISENKRENETSLYSSNSTSSKSPLLNFFIERYKDAYKNQLYDFSKFIKKNIRPLAEFEEGRRALIMANAAKKSISSKKFEKLTF